MTRKKWMQKGYFRHVVSEFKLGLRKWIKRVFSLTLFNTILIYFFYVVVGATFAISIGMNAPFLFDTAALAETFPNVIKGIPNKPFTQLPALAVSAAALIALITYRRGKQQATSKFFFEQSCQGLDEVYSLLKDKKNDRVIWVRAARSLLQAKKLAEEIELEEYKIAYRLYELRVRNDLYLALTMVDPQTGNRISLPAHFFFGLHDWEEDAAAKKSLNEVAKKAWRPPEAYTVNIDEVPPDPPLYPLSEKSVIAIYNFLDYPEDFVETLDDVKDWDPNLYTYMFNNEKSGAARYYAHRKTKYVLNGEIRDRTPPEDESK
jgi:hypothetical protein